MSNTLRNGPSASITGAINQLPTAIAINKDSLDIAYTAHTAKKHHTEVMHTGSGSLPTSKDAVSIKTVVWGLIVPPSSIAYPPGPGASQKWIIATATDTTTTPTICRSCVQCVISSRASRIETSHVGGRPHPAQTDLATVFLRSKKFAQQIFITRYN